MARFKTAADIKVGVIGYGGAFNMGKHHLNEMKLAGMTPTAVCELDPKRLEVATTDFPGIETYSTVKDLLKKSSVDLLAIITPHNTHAPLTIQCLKAGKGVVSEKPFAISTAECDAMIAAAKKYKAFLSTYHNRHWDGCILDALKVVQSGKIGDIIRIECRMGSHGQPKDWWRTSKSISGGGLLDWGVHLLEYSLQLLGNAKISEVTGFVSSGYWADKTAWKKDTIEDEGNVVVRMSTGQLLTLRISSIDSRPYDYHVLVTGTKGSLAFNAGSSTYELLVPGKNGVMNVERGKVQPSQSAQLYQNVANHLTKGEKLVITPEWARRPIHIIDLAYQSAKKGQALKAKYA
jgi:scyllo-inositol 2-dehydrogenase (NADP+)